MIRWLSTIALVLLGGLAACSTKNTFSGTSTIKCAQKAESDTDKDCKDQAGKPRKLDCSSETETDEAIRMGCTRTSPGDSDVCCPTTVTGAGASTSGTGTTPTVTCTQKAGSDTDSDCESQSGKPRKLDCSTETQTDNAIAAGCVRTKPGDSDVCCPTSVTGVSASSSGDAGSSGGTCNNYSGSWALSGTCGSTDCTVSQVGCAATVSCTDGTSLSGTMSGSNAQLSGSSGGQTLACSVSFSGQTSFSLTCNVCNGTGSKES